MSSHDGTHDRHRANLTEILVDIKMSLFFFWVKIESAFLFFPHTSILSLFVSLSLFCTQTARLQKAGGKCKHFFQTLLLSPEKAIVNRGKPRFFVFISCRFYLPSSVNTGGEKKREEDIIGLLSNRANFTSSSGRYLC